MKLTQRAQQVWQVLANAAHSRQVLTYSHLGEMIGMGAGTLAPALTLVMKYCSSRRLPPLTVLVVNSETGLPGSGLTTLEDLPRDREAVFQQKWLSMIPPTPSDFEAVGRVDAVPKQQHVRETYNAGERTGEGWRLNEAWNVGAFHALYHKDGTWYHQLVRFPGALFDSRGYILFETEEDFKGCPNLRIEKDVNVRDGISSIPGYVQVHE